MRHTDPRQERVTALRRARVATHGIVLGAAVASVGVAGALGLATAVQQGASPSTTTSPPTSNDANRSGQVQGWVLQGGDDDGELEGGLHWVPLQPSQQFGGGNGGGGAPHAQSSGS